MNALIQLINTVSRHLRAERIPHAVVGGIAVAIYGRPRATEDVDLLIEMDEAQLESFHAYLTEHDVRLDLDAGRTALREGRPFPAYDTWSIHWIDLRPAARPIDRISLERAVEVELAEEPVPVATPEDVILGKLHSQRNQDLLDARSIVLRKSGKLDLDYLLNRSRELGLEEAWDRVRPELV